MQRVYSPGPTLASKEAGAQHRNPCPATPDLAGALARAVATSLCYFLQADCSLTHDRSDLGWEGHASGCPQQVGYYLQQQSG
jgi:hypothetical protein